jgi:hypothetical protein
MHPMMLAKHPDVSELSPLLMHREHVLDLDEA